MGKEGRTGQSKTMNYRCPAMIEAGIDDPDSYSGIQFCLDCPYPDCIAFSGGSEIIKLREEEAKRLVENGYSISQIARELRLSRNTVKKYLRR